MTGYERIKWVWALDDTDKCLPTISPDEWIAKRVAMGWAYDRKAAQPVCRDILDYMIQGHSAAEAFAWAALGEAEALNALEEQYGREMDSCAQYASAGSGR